MTLRLIVLPLKDINHVLHILICHKLYVMMTLPCCYKVLVFMLVAILLLFDLTNFAKANNFADKDYNYQYPDYQSSTYIFFYHACTD